MAGFFGSARSRYAAAVARQKGLYGNGMLTNARAKNAARAQQKEATRALWSARKRRVMALLGKAKNGAVAVTRKVGSGLATGGIALAGAAGAAVGAAAGAAKMVAGKAYGAAGRAAQAAAAAAAAAAAKVRSYSVGRRAKNFFLGKKKLTETEEGIVRARGMNPNSTEARQLISARRRLSKKNGLTREGGVAGKLKAAARVVSEKTKAAVSATRKALGVAGAAISKGASNSWSFLGRKAGNARNYASRKAGNLRKGLSNMYTRMRFGGHEARLEAERQRAANAVNATKAALNRNSSAKAKAAGKTLGEIAAKLKKADVAAANGSNAAAAAAIGAAATAAKTASKKGFFSKLGNAAKKFTNGVGARLGKLRNMFKGTKKNGPKNNVPKSAMFKGSIVTNPDYKEKGPNSRSAFLRRMGTSKAASATGRLQQRGSMSVAVRKENKALKALRNAQVGHRAGLLAQMSPSARNRLGRFQNF